MFLVIKPHWKKSSKKKSNAVANKKWTKWTKELKYLGLWSGRAPVWGWLECSTAG